jgi:hypothetical protein
LGRFEKRRHRRPAEEDEARRKLVAVIEAREYVRADKRVCRGKIDRGAEFAQSALEMAALKRRLSKKS